MTLDERKKIKREKRRIYRLKRKEEMKKSGTTPTKSNTNNASHSNLKTLSGRKLNGRGKLSKLGGSRRNISSSILGINNFSNPINLILSEADNQSRTYSKYGTNSILPMIPVISDEIQTKIIEEQMRLDDYLIGKFKSKNSFLTPGKLNNKYLDNFLNLSGKTKKEGDRVVDSIDLTEETSIVTTKYRSNILPTEEEAKKVLSGLMKNNIIDFTGLNELSRTNPILYAKVNNLYLASLKSNNNNLIPVSQSINNSTSTAAVIKKSVKFPIEDSELYKNPEAYSLPKEYFNKPEGSKLLIPNEHISRIFKIWDFIHSFKSKLNVSEFTPEQLYFALKYFAEEEIPLLSEIHSSLIFIIGEQITSTDLSVLMNNDDYDLTLFKIVIENPSAPKRFIYKKCWIEVIKILINSKMFNLMVTEDLSDLSARLKYVNAANYNLLSFDEKIYLFGLCPQFISYVGGTGTSLNIRMLHFCSN